MINNLIELNIEKIEEILNSRLEDDEVTTLKDLPTPDVFKDMEKATDIISQAIDKNQKITIVGDYDVDGVVSTSILNGFFQAINKDVQIILPNRFKDGYGLSVDIIERVDTDLIITVDNGISAIEAGERAKERGISLVITDHHMCPKTLPYADAIINPKQDDCNFPESNIAGATVAWYVVAGLKKKMNLDLDLGSFLDLMAFAILADAMPLKSINRSFVKQGIRSINKSSRPAIQAMKRWLEINTFTTNDIIFSINPRLNSAGRMDDASVAYNFLNAKTVEEASYFLEELDRLNNFRKTKEKEILDLAKNQYIEQDDVIVVWGEDWHEGVIGIVAARLTDLYNKPSIVFSVIGEKAKGSGRSNPNVDLLKLITNSSEHLEGFGGHKQAAGMGCKTSSLESFKEACLTNFQEENNIEEVIFKDVFGKLSLDLVNMNLVRFLGQFEPYGQAFPFPQFFAHHVVPKKILKMGADKSHMLLVFEVAPYTTISAVWFNYDREISENETLSFIYTVGKNSFRGKEEAQVQIRKVL